MHYMLLVIADESKPPLPNPELTRLMLAYRDFTGDLVKSGRFRAGAPLQPSSRTTTVREEAGKRLVNDGPFADGKHQLAGYYLVECAHLDEAIAIAGRIPGVHLGEAIEIRPLVPAPDPSGAANVVSDSPDGVGCASA